MFAGYVASTISRDAGYDFLVLGRSLERVDMTARLLAAAVGTPARDDGLDDHAAGLLGARGVPAHVPARRRPAGRSLEFLLLDRLFPRSVLHALTVGEEALARLEPAAEWHGRSGRAPRRAG